METDDDSSDDDDEDDIVIDNTLILDVNGSLSSDTRDE